MMQMKLTEENAKRLDKAADIIAQAFSWGDTDEGNEYWDEVYERLRNKAANRTSDGKPYVEPEPEIPEGYRKANADEWRRKDVKLWLQATKEWELRYCQGCPFDKTAEHYIVPIDPPLTDQDACVVPRLLVMVRDHESDGWFGPYKYLGKSKHGYAVDPDNSGLSPLWSQARRATPEEIEAAK